MSRSALSVVFAGSGGSGAMTAGSLLLRAAARSGYYGQMTQLFGPQVRGGESAALVALSTAPVDCQPDRFDLFVALDWEKVDQFAPEIPLGPDSLIIADPADGPVPASIARTKARLVALPMNDPDLTRLDKALQGKRTNIFACALVAALAGLDPTVLRQAVAALFAGKEEAVQRRNEAALAAGFKAAGGLGLDLALAPPCPAQRWLITGNQAVSLGALRGGVRFVGCYPITPATDLVEFLSPRLQKLGGRLVLAEDELAAINMTLGASFGGVPAMTVTSGPGFSLMSESIGLGIAAEVPLLVVDVMRAGPSTGIPSKTEQSDLDIALHGGHGDAPRPVLAPTGVADCLATAEWAVYLAESLQTPVILLSDQALGQAQCVIDAVGLRPPPAGRRTEDAQGQAFKRYALSDDPVTPMPAPGTAGCQWVGEGLTHNELGIPVSGAAAHVAQIGKRARKLAGLQPGAWWGELSGDGDTAIIAFGSSVGPAREAASRLSEAGLKTRIVALRLLSPLPREALAAALAGVRRVIVLEQNHGAQLYRHLLAERAIPVTSESLARPGPLPFRAAEIVARLTEGHAA